MLEQGFIQEAEKVYREDLGISFSGLNAQCCHPNNIWSLRGLEECFIQIEKLSRKDNSSRDSDTQNFKLSLPIDYEDIMDRLENVEKLCEGDNYISSSCACKQTWNTRKPK